MTRHPENSRAQNTKRKIIEAAAPIFNHKGYAATSIVDITKATGLTKGGIYGHFKNKDEMALAAFEYNMSLITQAVEEAIRAQSTYRDKLLCVGRFYRDIHQSMLAMGGCPVVNCVAEADETLPELREMAARTINTWRDTLAHLIGRGQVAGEFGPADPRRLAQVIIALVEGGGIAAKASGDEEFLLAALDQVDRLIEGLAVG